MVLNSTELWDSDNDYVIIKVNIHGRYKDNRINAMIDSGATENFIVKTVCGKHLIITSMTEKPSEIYLADGKPSKVGLVKHIEKVLREIGGHWEIVIPQVVNLQNHKIILGMR